MQWIYRGLNRRHYGALVEDHPAAHEHAVLIECTETGAIIGNIPLATFDAMKRDGRLTPVERRPRIKTTGTPVIIRQFRVRAEA